MLTGISQRARFIALWAVAVVVRLLLLKLAAGLMLPTQGQVTFKGELVKEPLQKAGFVF